MTTSPRRMGCIVRLRSLSGQKIRGDRRADGGGPGHHPGNGRLPAQTGTGRRRITQDRTAKTTKKTPPRDGGCQSEKPFVKNCCVVHAGNPLNNFAMNEFPPSNPIHDAVEKFKEALTKIHEHIAEQLPKIEAEINAMNSDVKRALQEDPDSSPMGRIMNYRTTLWTQHGWFPSADHTPLSLISQTAELLGTSMHEQAEYKIASHFEEMRLEIIESVIGVDPRREQILRDALAAHDAGTYTLSIPVFLTQADGVGSAYFGIQSLYSVSADNFGRITSRFDQLGDRMLMKHFNLMVGILTPLNASQKVRSMYPAPLNRHTVIHGESTDYANRINSLKCISWIFFVSEICSDKWIIPDA